MKKIFILYFFSLSLIFSQSSISPEIEEILNKMENVFKNRIIETKVEFTMSGMGMTNQVNLSIIVDLKTEKFYMEIGDMSKMVYDGENIWNYNKIGNTYFKIPYKKEETQIKETPYSIIIPTKKEEIIRKFTKIDSATIENVEFEGKKSYLVKFKGKDFLNNDSSISLWLSSENYLPLQFIMNFSAKDFPEPMTMKYKIKSLKLDPQVPKDIFVFKPPEGAKELTIPEKSLKSESFEGKKPPDFTLTSLKGEKISLSSLKGKVVIIDFWASWCPPCREELKIIQKLHNEYKDKGVIILCINSNEEREKVKDFIDENNYNFTVLLDSDGKVSDNYRVKSIPRIFLINKEGIVVKDITGYSIESEKILKEEIEKIK
jgi:peroxiredoxin/outer membrane lipoprotein-sorting protein